MCIYTSVPCLGTQIHRTDLVQVVSLGEKRVCKGSCDDLRHTMEVTKGTFWRFFVHLDLYSQGSERTEDMESERLVWNLDINITLTNTELSKPLSVFIDLVGQIQSVLRWKYLTHGRCSLKNVTICYYYLFNDNKRKIHLINAMAFPHSQRFFSTTGRNSDQPVHMQIFRQFAIMPSKMKQGIPRCSSGKQTACWWRRSKRQGFDP